MKRQEFFQLIGQFAVEFEQACHEMELCAIDALEKGGLKSTATRQIILANQTAEPLRNLLQALLADFFASAKYKPVLDKVFTEMQSLIAVRNEIIHCKWNVPIDDPDWGINRNHVLGIKLKLNKDGVATIYPSKTIVDFANNIACCKRLQKIFSNLQFLLEYPEKLDEYFKVTGKTLELFPAKE